MWWFGNDFTSDDDAIFDSLFRRHIGNIYHLLGLPEPDGLDRPIKKSLGGRSGVMYQGEHYRYNSPMARSCEKGKWTSPKGCSSRLIRKQNLTYLADDQLPLLARRGVSGSKKKMRQQPYRRRRGGCSGSKRLVEVEPPPRPLHQRSFAIFLLMSRPPLLARRGDGPPSTFNCKTFSPAFQSLAYITPSVVTKRLRSSPRAPRSDADR